MRFYVPVGPRGVVFRFGMVATRAMGSLTYWYASSRRSASPTELTSDAVARARADFADLRLPRSPTAQPDMRPLGLVVAAATGRK